MEWLPVTNVRQDTILFAANTFFELMYDDECLQTTADESCFWVNSRWNGIDLEFGTCSGPVHRPLDNIGCSWSDFMSTMSTIWYSGESEDNLDEACSQAYVPYKDVRNIIQ